MNRVLFCPRTIHARFFFIHDNKESSYQLSQRRPEPFRPEPFRPISSYVKWQVHQILKKPFWYPNLCNNLCKNCKCHPPSSNMVASWLQISLLASIFGILNTMRNNLLNKEKMNKTKGWKSLISLELTQNTTTPKLCLVGSCVGECSLQPLIHNLVAMHCVSRSGWSIQEMYLPGWELGH